MATAVKEPEIINLTPKTETQPTGNIIDGRVFEADREVPLTDEERNEMREFNETFKKYNAISRRQLMEAIKEEKEALIQGKIKLHESEYFDGPTEERIRKLDTEYKLMEDIEKEIKRKVKQ